MSVLVFVEHIEGKVKKSSKEAVCYASALNVEVTALALGTIEEQELSALGKYGASKVLHCADERLNNGIIDAYASVVAQAIENSGTEIFILAKSSISDAVAAKVGVKLDASVATNVTELPDTSSGFRVKRSIFTGKAFALFDLTKSKKILCIRKR